MLLCPESALNLLTDIHNVACDAFIMLDVMVLQKQEMTLCCIP